MGKRKRDWAPLLEQADGRKRGPITGRKDHRLPDLETSAGARSREELATDRTIVKGIQMTTTPTTALWPADPAAACRRFFEEVEIASKPNRRIGTSYWIKHLVEAVAADYIPMRALTDVAAELGVPMEPCDSGPNCWLGITARSVNRFMQRYGIRGVA